MIAKDILTEEIAHLDLNADGNDASSLFEELKVLHIPIIENGKLSGILAEKQLYDIDDWSLPIKRNSHRLIVQFVQEGEHALQVLQKMSSNNLSAIPVVDQEMNYKGVILDRDLMQLFGNISLIKEQGAIIVLEVLIIDYSLAEISRLVESNNVKILGFYISDRPDNRTLEITLKLNKSNVDAVIQTLERFDYNIIKTIHKSPNTDGLQNRYDNLMKYLDL